MKSCDQWLRRVLPISLLLLIVFAYPRVNYAQGGTMASLSGTLVDQSGAVIPNAVVVIKNASSGDTRETKSNGVGDFTFTVLPVGDYSIDIKIPGFRELKQGGIHLDPGDQRSLREVKLIPEIGRASCRERV